MADAARFGARLRELREVAGLTQEELGQRVGVSARSVTYYEAGRLPTWDVVLALAEALGVDCTAFTEPPAEREPPKPGGPPKGTGGLPSAAKKAKPRPRRKGGSDATE